MIVTPAWGVKVEWLEGNSLLISDRIPEWTFVGGKVSSTRTCMA